MHSGFTKRQCEVNFFQKYLFWMVTLGLLAFSFLLRFHNLHFLPYAVFSDSGRDLLVARHMALGKASLLVSPASSYGWWPHTPAYYWLLAGLYSVFHAITPIYYIYAFIGWFSIVIAFKIGKEMGYLSAIACLLFFSTNAILVYFSIVLAQPYIVITFTMLGLFFLMEWIKKKHQIFLLSALFIFILGLFIHESMIFPLASLFLIFFLGVVDTWGKLFSRKSGFIFTVFSIIMLFLYSYCSFGMGRGNLFGFLFFFFSEDRRSFLEIGERVIGNFFIFTQYLFGAHKLFGALLLGSFFIFYLVHFIKGLRQKKINFASVLFLMQVSFIFTFFLPDFSDIGHFYMPFYPIFLLSLGCSPSLFVKPFFRWVAFTFLFFTIIFMTQWGYVRNDFKKDHLSFYENHILAKYILMDTGHVNQYKNEFSFTLVTQSGSGDEWLRIDEWFTGGVWYALEELTQLDLTAVVPSLKQANNIQPIARIPKFTYLICIERFGDIEYTWENCLNSYKSEYTWLNAGVIARFYSHQNGYSYALYRFQNL